MPTTPLSSVVSRIGDRVWFARTDLVNWAAVRTPNGVVLIDAGYPDHADAVLATVEKAGEEGGNPELAAILVTHAHTDHIGGIPEILRRHPETAVLSAAAEVQAVRGPEREQITIRRMGTNLLRPKFVSWLRAGIRAGGLRDVTIPNARAFTTNDLDAFGIRAHNAAGHTIGSTVYEIVGENIVVTGDAYVTGHLSYRQPRNGAIAAHFSTDPTRAREAAAGINTRATILPGHGPALLPARTSP